MKAAKHVIFYLDYDLEYDLDYDLDCTASVNVCWIAKLQQTALLDFRKGNRLKAIRNFSSNFCGKEEF